MRRRKWKDRTWKWSALPHPRAKYRHKKNAFMHRELWKSRNLRLLKKKNAHYFGIWTAILTARSKKKRTYLVIVYEKKNNLFDRWRSCANGAYKWTWRTMKNKKNARLSQELIIIWSIKDWMMFMINRCTWSCSKNTGNRFWLKSK